MNRKTAFSILASLLLAFQVFAQTAPAYPYLIVTPVSPAANKDSVTVRLILGTAGNSCMAPTFSNENFTIVPSMLAVYPPQFSVNVTYTTIPVPPGKLCPLIYMPVQYGPVFNLGKLALGTYNVVDSGRIAGTFFVGDVSFPNAGSTDWHDATFRVATDKAVYYTTDSLSARFYVINNLTDAPQSYGPFGGNCLYDLIISLKGGIEIYRLSTNAACLKNIVYQIVNPGATITHDFPKFGYPAGIEAYVAALDSVVLTVSAQFWGTAYDSTRASVDITIKRPPSTVLNSSQNAPALKRVAIVSAGRLEINVPLTQKISVQSYSTDGRLLPGVSISRIFGAGLHSIPLNRGTCAEGVSIIRVKGETFGATVKMVKGIDK